MRSESQGRRGVQLPRPAAWRGQDGVRCTVAACRAGPAAAGRGLRGRGCRRLAARLGSFCAGRGRGARVWHVLSCYGHVACIRPGCLGWLAHMNAAGAAAAGRPAALVATQPGPSTRPQSCIFSAWSTLMSQCHARHRAAASRKFGPGGGGARRAAHPAPGPSLHAQTAMLRTRICSGGSLRDGSERGGAPGRVRRGGTDPPGGASRPPETVAPRRRRRQRTPEAPPAAGGAPPGGGRHGAPGTDSRAAPRGRAHAVLPSGRAWGRDMGEGFCCAGVLGDTPASRWPPRGRKNSQRRRGGGTGGSGAGGSGAPCGTP
jgi:hypothetical protein